MPQMQETQDLIYKNSREYSRVIDGILAVEAHARDLARKLDSDALLCAAFRAGYEAGYMHSGPKGLVLDEVVPSSIEIAAIRAAVESVQ